jgi:hypothetical protein
VIIPDIERQLGAAINRLVAYKGYRGHNAPENTSSGFTSPARSAASPRRSNAISNGDQPLSPSLDTPNQTAAWTASISKARTATLEHFSI